MGGVLHAFTGFKVDIDVNAEADVSRLWNLMEMGCLGYIILERMP
jgi:hypothetical protein